MNFKIPTELFCDSKCISKHKTVFSKFGKRALIVTGSHSAKQNGSLKDVEEVLNELKIHYSIFDSIKENPSIENILEAVNANRTNVPDFVIGIGGGSPLDASKAIALMLANPSRGSDILYHSETLPNLPVIAIPTTCGTGSEVTPYSILTIHNSRTKASISHHIFPKYALIDPDYLLSASADLIKNTLTDALGHLIESYINTRSTNISRMFCEKGFRLWNQCDHITNFKSLTYEERETLMLCSSLAGMAIAHTGTSLPHGMSYPLTYEHAIPHGKAVGTFLASYLGHADEIDRQFILQQLGYDSCESLGDRIRQYIGIVTISSYEIEFSIAALMKNEKKLANCPYKVDESILRDIYNQSVILS